ncbi:MAG: hypothetical protein KDE35_10095 [Geminicoccaceae bacterium]|nr:hypothetical protein [Geminicoccaceae bacterium]
MTLVAVLHRLSRETRGNIAVMGAAGIAMAFGAASVAVDLGAAYTANAELQTTADAAALAAATRLPDAEAAVAAAIGYARKNMSVEDYGEVLTEADVIVGHWDAASHAMTPDTRMPSAVQVTPRLGADRGNALSTMFAGVFGLESLDVAATAVAGKVGPPCVIALDPLMPGAARLQDGATLEAPDCAVQVNARAPGALIVGGNARIEAETICVSGGAAVNGSAYLSPAPSEYCPAEPDPMTYLQAPATSGCDVDDEVIDGTIVTLSPGIYCGGLRVMNGAQVQLEPGLYVIKNGKLAVTEDSRIEGDGVTFFLDGLVSIVELAPDAVISLAAPTDGSMAGILFYQNRNFGGVHKWDSRNVRRLFGTVYVPTGVVRATSDATVTPRNSCSVIIAARLDLGRNSRISIDLTSSACKQYLASPFRRAVALLD